MTKKSEERWANAEDNLPEELRPILGQLRADYLEAQHLHVPDYTGGPNPEILAALIQVGWRKED